MRALGLVGFAFQGAVLQIRAGAERPFARAGDHRHPDIVVALDFIEMLRKLPAQFRVKRVHRFRAIERDPRDVAVDLEKG